MPKINVKLSPKSKKNRNCFVASMPLVVNPLVNLPASGEYNRNTVTKEMQTLAECGIG